MDRSHRWSQLNRVGKALAQVVEGRLLIKENVPQAKRCGLIRAGMIAFDVLCSFNRTRGSKALTLCWRIGRELRYQGLPGRLVRLPIGEKRQRRNSHALASVESDRRAFAISPTSVTMFGGRGIRSTPSFLNPCSALSVREPSRVTICQRARRRPRAGPLRSLDRLP